MSIIYTGFPQIKVGTLFAQAQWSEYDFDPVRGLIIHASFEASSTQAAEQLYNYYVNQGVACNLRYENGKGTLRIIDSTNAFSLDNWELKPNDETLDPLLNPFVIEGINSGIVPPNSYNKVIAAIRQNLAVDVAADDAFTGPILGPYFNGELYLLYTDMQAGLTGWRNDANGEGYVLHHSTNVSNQSQENIADFGTGQIYTTAQLISEVTNGALWNNVLPNTLVYKILNLVKPTPKYNWVIGWFKSRSEYNNAANNRIDIVTNYTFGQFEAALYDVYSGATS